MFEKKNGICYYRFNGEVNPIILDSNVEGLKLVSTLIWTVAGLISWFFVKLFAGTSLQIFNVFFVVICFVSTIVFGLFIRRLYRYIWSGQMKRWSYYDFNLSEMDKDIINKLSYFVANNKIYIGDDTLRAVREMKKNNQSANVVAAIAPNMSKFLSKQNVVINHSPLFSFCIDQESGDLTIKIDPEGTSYSFIDDCSMELSSLLGMKCISSLRGREGYTYKFTSRVEERINYEDNVEDNFDFKPVKSNVFSIKLNSAIDWNLEKNPHCVCLGKTGSGKTFFIYHVIAELLNNRSKVIIIDPKGTELGQLGIFNRFLETYNISNYYDDGSKSGMQQFNSDVFKVLKRTNEEITNRSKLINDKIKETKEIGFNFRKIGLTPYFLIIDEMLALKDNLKDKKARDDFDDLLSSILAKGRQLGVFVMLATQKLEADSIPTRIKANCMARFQIGNLDRISKGQLFDDGSDLDVIYDLDNAVGKGYYKFATMSGNAEFIEYPFLSEKVFISQLEENEKNYIACIKTQINSNGAKEYFSKDVFQEFKEKIDKEDKKE